MLIERHSGKMRSLFSLPEKHKNKPKFTHGGIVHDFTCHLHQSVIISRLDLRALIGQCGAAWPELRYQHP